MTSTIDFRRKLATALCKRRNTGQCAAICMTHSSLFTSQGRCPESINVFGQDVQAVLDVLTEPVHGDVSVFQIYDALRSANISYSALSWNGFNVFGDQTSIKEVQRLMHRADQTEKFQNELIRSRKERETLCPEHANRGVEE